MLHAYDSTGQNQPPPYNTTIDLVSNSSIALVDGYSPYLAMANNGVHLLLNIYLEAAIDGVSYKFDYSQTMFVDKSQRLDKFLSTVTLTTVISPIPGTTVTGKSDSLSARLGFVFGCYTCWGRHVCIAVRGWRGGNLFIKKRARISPSLDSYYRIWRGMFEIGWLCLLRSFRWYGEHHYFEVVNALNNFEKTVIHYGLLQPVIYIIDVKWKVISMSYTYTCQLEWLSYVAFAMTKKHSSL